jgi:hypothetical protein
MTLTAEQVRAVQRGEAVFVTVDKTDCVLVRRDVYDQGTPTYDDSPLDIRDAYPLMDEVARREGWDDPAEDLYDDLVPKKR